MSHNIQQLDIQEGIEQAWHGLTQVVPRINLRSCWLTKWDIERVPLYIGQEETVNTAGKPMLLDCEQTKFDMLCCTDNGHQVGKPVGKSYGEITNAQFLDMIEQAIGGTKHTIVSVGSLRNRGRVFVTLKLNQDTLRQIGKRSFQDYLTAGTSHDQSCELFWVNSSTCTVCDNTFSMNLATVRQAVDNDSENEDNANVRLRHSKHAVSRLPSISAIIDRAVGVRAEFYTALESFAKTPCNDKRAERIFTGFEASKEAEGVSAITGRRVRDLCYLYSKGRGNEGKTILDVFSAGTDYYTHASTQSMDMQRQFESSEYGLGRARKQALFSTLNYGEKLEATERRGEKLLNAVMADFE